jgi:hypothetical protein
MKQGTYHVKIDRANVEIYEEHFGSSANGGKIKKSTM